MFYNDNVNTNNVKGSEPAESYNPNVQLGFMELYYWIPHRSTHR